MKNKILIAALLTTLLIVSGCRLILRQMKPNFFAGNDAFTAAQAVKSKVGASFRVRTIEITEDKFTMKIESPGNPRNIDEYTYVGLAAVGPKPLPFDPYDAKETDRMPFDEIDFSVIPQIVQSALDRARIEGGKVTEIMFYTKVGNKFGWDVQIKGTRESASVRADMKGNVVGADLSQTVRAADYKVLNETELNKASDAIKAKFGADAQIADLHIKEKQIGFTAKNPQNEKEVFTYVFGIDGLKKTAPTALPANMMRDSFSFNSINFADVISLSQRAKERLGMPNGEIDSINFLAMPVLIERPISSTMPNIKIKEFSSEMRWTISVRQGSDTGEVQYDAKLNEVSGVIK